MILGMVYQFRWLPGDSCGHWVTNFDGKLSPAHETKIPAEFDENGSDTWHIRHIRRIRRTQPPPMAFSVIFLVSMDLVLS